MDKLFQELKKENGNLSFNRLAYYMAELNVIHPFREGNGRAIREFIRLLALKNGYELNWGNVDKDLLMQASVDSVYNYEGLIEVLKECLVVNR